GLVRPAAFAWTKSGTLGIRAGFVERHVLPQRQARRTRRPAIDPSRPHRVNECTIRGAIAPLHGPPARAVVKRGQFRVFVDSHYQGHALAPSGLDGNLWIAAPQALRSLLSNQR